MTSTMRTRLLPIGVITLLAAAARIAVIGEPMRFDEAVTWANYVGKSWWVIVTSYTYPNNHVFYSLLAKVTGAPFGYQPWALRLPALLAGIAIIPLTWLFGRRLADERTALVGAALAAGSTALALFSVNARGYTLVVACFLVLLLLADGLRVQPSRRAYVLIAVIGGLGLFTIPIMMYPLGIVGVWAGLNAYYVDPAARRTYLLHLGAAMLGAVALAGLLYSPIMMSAGVSALVANKFVAPADWFRFTLEVVPMVVETLASWASPWPPVAMIVLLPLALAGALPERNARHASLALAATLWCFALLVLMHRAPFARVWLFLLPLFLLAVSRGLWRALDAITRTRASGEVWAALLIGVAVALQLVRLHTVQLAEDTGLFHAAPQVATLIGPQLRSGDRILAPMPTNGPVLYYISRAGFDSATMNLPYEKTRRVFIVFDTHHKHDMAWAFANGLIDTLNFKPANLLQQYPDAEVWLSERKPQ